MKHLIIIIFLFANMSTFAQNTYVPDDNFEQALIDLGYDTGTLDDYVPTANISGLTTLNVSDKNISDLTGIEDFAALTELYCWTNQLTSLDVSANTSLTFLLCDSNQLTSLDVLANTSLTYLSCSSNQLTSLDVSANTSLTDLWCDSNQLTSLDVSANTSLTYLYCWSNQLTSLDVSANTSLTGLDCYSNQLTSLDISANTSLTYFHSDSNQLTSLDVSANTSLIGLYCSSNQLTSLDVRNGNNANITVFHAQNNPNLTCIYVDDKDASYLSDWTIDPASTFVETEAECDALNITDIINDAGFRIYPNPTKEKFSIETSSEIESVKIYDIFGKLHKVYKKQDTYSIEDLATGVYLIYVQSKAGISISKLIIK